MSCRRPTTPHSSSSSPVARAYARIAASTARQWRRSDSDSTHSVRRVQASSRESRTDMAVRLAEPPHPPRAAPVRMEKFVIDGGGPLRGTVVPAGNKNGALPILAASVLTSEDVVVSNVPRIRDVEAMLRVLRGIGVSVEWRDDNEVCLNAGGVDRDAHIDRDHGTRIRASFLLAGPLLARFGHADMPPPGADITGIGSNVLTVTGRHELGGCDHRVGPDHIEIGSFIALAGVTGGELRIRDTQPHDLRMVRLVFERLGLRTELDGADVVVPGDQSLIAQRDVGEFKAKIQDGPWPAFPADLTSIAIALATQCSGSVLVHEWMFENRMIFTDKLV